MKEQPDHDHAFQAEKIEHLVDLIMKYKRDCITSPDQQALDEWAGENDANLHLFTELTDEKNMKEAMDWISAVHPSQALKKLKGKLHFEPPRHRRFSIFNLLLHCAIAASITMMLLFALFIIDKE